MPKYRKKPVEIEAFQLNAHNLHNISTWPWYLEQALGKGIARYHPDKAVQALQIETLEGVHRADLGDWIIRGVKGELYPCKPDIFALTYDLVEED